MPGELAVQCDYFAEVCLEDDFQILSGWRFLRNDFSVPETPET